MVLRHFLVMNLQVSAQVLSPRETHSPHEGCLPPRVHWSLWVSTVSSPAPLLLMIYFHSMCMSGLHVCRPMRYQCAWCPQGPEEGNEPPGSEVGWPCSC